MNKTIKCIFIFIFTFSVFSLTLQSAVIQICKESKVFKNQSQQSPITEEEEESHDSDESVDKELVYLNNNSFSQYTQRNDSILWKTCELNYLSGSIEIPIPPPKFS
ncbi:MAG: hypothetical protein JNM51_12605 [Bacteroidia bacterium]|nr:hypothetical protein [Bacteroidia bacterium]